MSHSIRSTVARAVTVYPPALAEASFGPVVDEPGSRAHIHTGNPTYPIFPGSSSGTIPISIADKFI
ncbi:hypothetical protein [Myceligenerans indicum]|uniref:Uncharacterized protein n=1 Tax=Myceligenerans indicum TaxID=2593663 RepID=A0ABS1LF09_9MICO|nr:hypothetical protein [Myceligenerans indicum]MBL0884850.1 hypothetical protein [Myceligenerans indicum]